VVDLGYNYRIDEIRAALGRVQLSKLDRNNERRRNLSTLYREQLQEMAPDIIIPFKEPRGIPSSHIMPILLPNGSDRLQFMERMKSFGIQTSIHYPPIHKFKIYDEGDASCRHLPLTEDIVKREVTIPLYPTMSEDDVLLVAQAVRDSLYNIKHD
jgi:dTDP-4-amino-4,6-dideoxygalactose transaminase